MTPIQEKVVAARSQTVREMVRFMETLPLATMESFAADPRMVAAGESFLRRALEALLDLGRQLLAQGFEMPVVEYAAVGPALNEVGVVTRELAKLLEKMGRYRNRLTHGYQEATPQELYTLLTERRHELLLLLEGILAWLREHPERVARDL